MICCTNIEQLYLCLEKTRKKNKKIGFVPTMGALHEGHLSLIKYSKNKSDITICSIFINPTQFNKKNDFNNYPFNIEKDKKILQENECDIVFIPKSYEIYPNKIVAKKFNFGNLDKVMEGKNRPGHFNGVATVVQKFIKIIRPHYSFFGEKDFQQLAIIKNLVNNKIISTKIISCSTIRSNLGLALSSRNKLLTKEQLKQALLIYRTLVYIKKNIEKRTIRELKTYVQSTFLKSPLILEYFEISTSDNLTPIEHYSNKIKVNAFIAAHLGNVRLIDNLRLN